MHTFWRGGWQVRDVDVEEKGRQDRSLWDAVLEASKANPPPHTREYICSKPTLLH